QEVGDAPCSRGVHSSAGRERARDHREEGAVDQRVPVHEVERGGRHGRNNNRTGMKNPARRPGGETQNGAGTAYTRTTFAACSPFSPAFTSNSTTWPSASVLKPSIRIAAEWRNPSSPAS